eukprot:753889_1
MVNWFEKKSSSSTTAASSDLSSPLLLPHGTNDNDNRTTSQNQRDINMAFATQAVATQSPLNGGRDIQHRRTSTGRRSSAYRDSLRYSRRYKLHQIQKQSTRLSNISADRLLHLSSTTSSMYGDLGLTCTESEVSDYGIDDVVKPNQTSGQSSNESKEKTKNQPSTSAT